MPITLGLRNRAGVKLVGNPCDLLVYQIDQVELEVLDNLYARQQ